MQNFSSRNTLLSNADPTNDTLMRGYDIDVEDIAQLRKTYEELRNVLQKSNLQAKVEGISNMIDNILEAEEFLTTVQKYRARRNDWDIKSISFSRLTPTHYNRLNVEIRRVVPAVAFETALEFLNRNDATPKLPLWNYADIKKGISRITGWVNLQREAGCRMLIDQHIYCLMDHRGQGQRNVIYVIPELQLSRSAKDAFPVPIEIPLAKKSTLLSGSTDYGLLIIPEQEDDEEVANAVHDVLKAESSRELLFNMDGGRFVVVEAKGNPLDLEKCVPQVVGQCLAIGTLVPATPQVAFCLTTGVAWIFGVVDCSGSGSVCWYTEEIAMTVGDVDRIMKPFFLWANRSGQDIRDMFAHVC